MDRFVVRKRRSSPKTGEGPEKSARLDTPAEIDQVRSMIRELHPARVNPERWRQTRNCGLHVDYDVSFLPQKTASMLLRVCEENLEYFVGDLARVRVFGKWHDIPRKHVAFGDHGLTYKFSHTTVPAKPWPPFLSAVRDLVSDACGCHFNFVLVNRYANGNDYMGEHKDDEGDLEPKAPIASVSLGLPRDFIFRHEDARLPGRGDAKQCPPPVKFELAHGSLLVMRHPTNDVWYHSLPKRARANGLRLNFTFRVMRMQARSGADASGQA